MSIENKIRKLLALAGNNPNLNEAAVAFERAQALATAHMLDLEDLATDDQPEAAPPRKVGRITERCLDTWRKTIAWKTTIGSAVARANACKTYRITGDGGLYAYGQADDLATVHLLYSLITSRVEAMAKAAVAEYRGELIAEYGSVRAGVQEGEHTPRTYGRSFRLGAAAEIARRLRPAQTQVEALAAAETDGSTALVRIEAAAAYLERVDQALTTYGKETLRLRAGSGFTGSRSSSGYAAGRSAGRGVSLGSNRAITS